MPPKRSSPDSGSGSSTRQAKAAKTDSSSSTPSKSKKGGTKGVKAAIPLATFKATAMPLHVNVTHTPPATADADSEAPATASADPGFIGSLTLVPSSFSTGSYGWKGSKRITIELQNSEDGDAKEKVQVMLTINATVLGSKQAKSGEGEEMKEDEADAPAGEDEAKERYEKV